MAIADSRSFPFKVVSLSIGIKRTTSANRLCMAFEIQSLPPLIVFEAMRSALLATLRSESRAGGPVDAAEEDSSTVLSLRSACYGYA